MSALAAIVRYGPLSTYDCLTGQVEIFWVGYDWHDEEFCTRYEAIDGRAIWLLGVMKMTMSRRRRTWSCMSSSHDGEGTMGRRKVTGSIAGYLLSRGCKCDNTGARRHGAHPDRVLDPGKEDAPIISAHSSPHVHIYNDHTLISPSLPPLTRYLSQNLILSTGLTCPLTTSFLCSPDVRL